MKVAIIGGTGFVGTHLAKKLLSQDLEVVVTGRGERGPEQEHPKLSFAKAPVSDAVALVKAVKGCDAVVNCAGINRETGKQTFESVHITGTNHLLSALRQTGVRRLVQISFLRARNLLDSPYHVTKWQAEEAVRKSGLDYTILKPGVIYGQGDQFLSNLKTTISSFPFFGLVGNKPTPIAPLAVTDLCDVVYGILDDNQTFQKTYEVVGPDKLTLADVVDRTAASMDIIPTKIPLPVLFHRIAAIAMERFMKHPLLTAAQVTMLSESLSEGTPECEKLPENLMPQTPFLEAESQGA